MRACTFIVVLEEPPPKIDFSLKDLPSSSKIDVVARNLQVIFPLKINEHLFRYIALFTKTEPMIFATAPLLKPSEFLDEIEIASIIKKGLKQPKLPFTVELLEKQEGFMFYTLSTFDFFLKECLKNEGKLIYLKEDGVAYNQVLINLDQTSPLFFILGGRRDISEEHEITIKTHVYQTISLGDISYLASTCILKIIYELTKELK